MVIFRVTSSLWLFFWERSGDEFTGLSLGNLCHFYGQPNRPFSYSRYWTGTSLQLRLMQGVFSNANDINRFLLIFFHRTSFHCKLVPLQYREHEYMYGLSNKRYKCTGCLFVVFLFFFLSLSSVLSLLENTNNQTDKICVPSAVCIFNGMGPRAIKD